MSAPTEITGAGDLRTPPVIPDHTLQRVIGRGSYGEVWEARNVMGTSRAVKIVRRGDFDSARPFEREFEGIQRYEPVSRTHAGLVQVLHVGKDDGSGCFYYVMELGDSAGSEREDYKPKTLRTELQARHTLPVEECIEIGITLASALGHLHRAGLVHRDVKPSNIIFVAGVAKLADVGLVARLSDSRSMVGTEGYFAPEGTGQPRSDVYSLGKVLYECVTGQDRMNFPDVPESWSSGSDARAAFEFMEIVLRAAESNPDRRYPDTDEMLADLALLKAGKSLRHLRRVETRLRRALQVLAISVLAITIAGGAWFYERYRRGQVETAEATATQAQQRTQQLLVTSLIAEARAVRLSGQAGARDKALRAVAQGLKEGGPLVELRTQAASALALTDVGPLDMDRLLTAKDGLLRWSPDGARAVLAEHDSGRLRIVDRDTGKDLIAFDTAPDVHAVVVSAGARRVITRHRDGSARLWNTAGGKLMWMLPASSIGSVLDFSRDGTWLIAATEIGLIARACEGGETVTLVPDVPPMRAIYLSPDATWIAALPVPPDGPGKPAKDLGFRIYMGLPGRLPLAADAAGITPAEITSDIRLEGVSVSADSRYLAAAVGEDRLRVWEMPSMQQVAWLRGHQRSVRGTAFHPRDSGIIASTSWDGTTQLWDIPTRRQILVIPTGGENVLISPDRGELLLRTWDGGTLRSAPLSTRSALRVLMLPAGAPLGLFAGVHFSPDGFLVAAAGDAGAIAWDTATGIPFTVQPPTKPERWRDLAFSPDNSACWFSGKDGLFRRRMRRDAAGHLSFEKREEIMSGYASFLQWCGETLAVSGRHNEKGQPGVALLAPDGTSRILVPTHSPDRICASPDGRWLAATRYPGGGGTLWDLQKAPPPAVDVASFGRAEFGFTSDSRALITGTDTMITFTRADAPEQEAAPTLSRRDCEFVPAHSASSAAAGLTAVSTGPTEITLCDTRTLRPVLRLDSPLTPFDTSLAFSPDGKFLALAGGVSRVVLWDVAWIKEELTRRGLGW